VRRVGYDLFFRAFEPLEFRGHLVERRRENGHLVLADDGNRFGMIAPRDALGRLCENAEGTRDPRSEE
jgi:hypothetical protein